MNLVSCCLSVFFFFFFSFQEAGVRVLVAYLFATDVDTWQSKSEAVPIFKLLFKLIENDGRLPPADDSEQVFNMISYLILTVDSYNTSFYQMDEVEDEHSRDERNRVCLAAGRGLLGTIHSRISMVDAGFTPLRFQNFAHRRVSNACCFPFMLRLCLQLLCPR